jgi:hypothetical protein
VRTFCWNPRGEVSEERYDDLAVVNGHSYKEEVYKTRNTNFALWFPSILPSRLILRSSTGYTSLAWKYAFRRQGAGCSATAIFKRGRRTIRSGCQE